MTSQTSRADAEIKVAAQLSIAEIGFGSIGHAFKIPLTGHWLSLNQLAFLLNAVNRSELPASSAFEISGIAAVLKSFSPAGKKLGPMLSIAMQGFLFWVGLVCFGTHIVGQLLGAFLLVLWAFVQPLLTLFLIYGTDLIKIVDFYVLRLHEDYAFVADSIVLAIVCLIFFKVAIGLSFVLISKGLRKELTLLKEARLIALLRPHREQKNISALKGALRDLVKPLFLLSFVLMTIFIWQYDGGLSEKVWLLLRPLGTAFLLFYILRSPWVAERLFKISKKSKKFESIYNKSKAVLDLVAQRSSGSPEVSTRREIE